MDTTPELVTLQPGPALAIRARVAMAELPAFFARAFADLYHHAGGQAAGPPFARYHAVDAHGTDLEAIVPLRAAREGSGTIRAIELPGGPAVQIRHLGPYEELAQTYQSIERWLAANHRERADAVREVYLTSPQEVPDPSGWVTMVIQPVRPEPSPVAR